jgi:hypothetical protein
MVINMKANFIMMNIMVKELFIGKILINIRVIGLMVSSKEKELILFNKVGINIKANFLMIHFMVRDLFIGKMGTNMSEIGYKVS